MKRRHPDSAARFWSSAALIACVAVIVVLAACGCRDFEAYVALTVLAIMSGFIATTQDA
jgi:hypothetical protein